MASWTPSQPGGAGAGSLNKDLEDVRVGVQVLLTAQAQASYVWTVFDKPDAASTVTIVNATSQVANVTFASKGIYGIELSDPATGTSKVLYLEVNRDAAGDLIDHGVVAPALAQGQATSVTGRGVARTMERFAAAVLVAIAAGGGGGANLDPAGPLALGTANATSVAIGRTAADFTALGAQVVVRAQSGTYEYSGDAGTSGLFADGTDLTLVQPNGNIKLHPDGGVEVGAVDPLQFSSGLVSYAASGGTLRVNARTTDVAPGTLDIHAGGAWNTAVTNLVGGNLRLRGGEPKTRGTQKYGDVQVSVGRHIADGTTAKFAIVYGDATDNPFENELLTVARTNSGASVMSPTGLFFNTTSGSLQHNAGPAGDYIALSGAGSVGLSCSNDAGPIFEMVTSSMYVGVYNTDSFQVSLLGSGNFYVTSGAPSTDVAAQQIAFKAPDATTFATAVAGNKTGGSFSFNVGRGRTPGTDPAGAFYFGLGDTVSNAIAGGLVLGYGAAVGTIGTAAYRPFTTEVGRIRVVANEFTLTGPYIRISATTNGILEGNAAYVTAYSGPITLSCTSTAQLTSSAGPSHLVAPAVQTCSMNGGFVANRCATTFTIENYNASFQYEVWTFASNLQTSKWSVTNYAAREERRYFYGTSTSTATVFLAGAFIPPVANGLVTIKWKIKGSTASGATGYMRYQVDTYRIAAGVMTALSSTVLATHTNLASAPTVVASTLTVGNTTLGLAVAAGDSVSTRWEGYARVEYAAAA